MSFSKLLADARRDLIDTTLRNPLINYPWEKTKRGVKIGTTSVATVAEIIKEVIEATPVQFTALPNSLVSKKSQQQIHTDLLADGLQKRLIKLFRETRAFEEEQGFNVLHLASGFLEWYESDSSEQALLSPLLLLPFQLQLGEDGRFTCQFTQEEIEDNASLRQKLQGDFGINLVTWAEIDQDETIEDKFSAYTEKVGKQLSLYPDCRKWVVHTNRVVLDLFSFARLAMYQDLDPSRITESDVPILSTLLTPNGSFRATQGGDMDVDVDVLPATELDNIMVADSSQTEAIKKALRGDHLVIQGPPGTGKSQTIANLIASLVRRGKKVLFVAEKMAALSVVKRRLDQAGLGQVCLELHSHKTRPKDVLAELKRTLLHPLAQAGQSLLEPVDTLMDTREQLRKYYQQLMQPIEQTGFSPYQAIGELAKMSANHPNSFFRLIPELATAVGWDSGQLTRNQTIVDAARRRINEAGPVCSSPFYGSELRTITILLQQQIGQELEQLQQIGKQVADCIDRARLSHLPIDEKSTLVEIDTVLSQLKRVIDKPTLNQTLNQNSSEWASQRAFIGSLFQVGKSVNHSRSDLDRRVTQAAFTNKIYLIRQAYQQHEHKWYRWLIGEFKQAQHTLKSYCKIELPTKVADQRLLIDAIINHNEQTAVLGKMLPSAQQWLQGVHTENFSWLIAEAAANYLVDLHHDIEQGSLPDWVLYYLNGATQELSAISANLAGSLSQWKAAWGDLYHKLAFPEHMLTEKLSAPFQQLAKVLNQMQASYSNDLQRTIGWNNSRFALSENGLASLIPLFEAIETPADNVFNTYCFSVWAHLTDHARLKRPQLQDLCSSELNRLSALFARSEEQLLAVNRAQTHLYHQRNLPNQSASMAIGQMGVLHREFNKQRRLLPLRKLFTEAGTSIQAIKPVVMMSPLSIARYVPQQALQFDVVIFDEASQVKPVDAFGALMRAKQAIVVGDEQQMPPTAFFDNTLVGEDTDEDAAGDSLVKDTESILQLFAGREAAQSLLQWHYRSRHDSLIRVSNQQFYDDRLLVTPSPLERGPGLGLRLERVIGIYQPKVGNLIEANAVVEAIIHHARTQPQRTLGVVALNIKQVDLIENQLDKVSDPIWVAYRNAHPGEPFFVKSLESVQGDERDVIFISVSFGKQQDGSLHMRFGPVNGEGGHRRLNVLFSRAKEECVVFTGLTASDIRTGESTSRGLPVLKAFLQFAETGEMPVVHSEGTGTESPFEDSVKTVLEQAGYLVDTQIGASGFRIDLGVRNPAYPNEKRYLAGIECDGATYHRSRIARDRDFIRQQVLEGMGWHIYRIWSTDWFHNNLDQQRKLLEHLEYCKTTHQTLVEKPIESLLNALVAPVLTEEIPGTLPSNFYMQRVLRRQSANVDLHEVLVKRLLDLTVELVQHEGPVHSDYVMRRLAEAFGVGKIGNRIHTHLTNVFKYGEATGVLFKYDDFLWTVPASLNVPLRSRENVPLLYRKVEWIAPQEIQAAILILLKQNQAAERMELLQMVMKLLGFQRLTSTAHAILAPTLDELIRRGQVVDDGHQVRYQA